MIFESKRGVQLHEWWTGVRVVEECVSQIYQMNSKEIPSWMCQGLECGMFTAFVEEVIAESSLLDFTCPVVNFWLQLGDHGCLRESKQLARNVELLQKDESSGPSKVSMKPRTVNILRVPEGFFFSPESISSWKLAVPIFWNWIPIPLREASVAIHDDLAMLQVKKMCWTSSRLIPQNWQRPSDRPKRCA